MEETNAAKARAKRGINPFTGQTMAKEEVERNSYDNHFHERAKKLFAEGKTFGALTEILQSEFPHYSLNDDKTKNYFLRYREEFLEARDDLEGRLAEARKAEAKSLFLAVEESNAASIEPILERKLELLKALKWIDPEENPAAYSTCINGINKLTKLADDLSGVTAARNLSIMRNQALLAMDMKQEMIRRGLIPQISRPSIPSIEAMMPNDNDWRPSVINADGSIEAEAISTVEPLKEGQFIPVNTPDEWTKERIEKLNKKKK